MSYEIQSYDLFFSFILYLQLTMQRPADIIVINEARKLNKERNKGKKRKKKNDKLRKKEQVWSTNRCVLSTYFFNLIRRQTDGPTDIPSCRDAILHFCDVPGTP